MVLTMFGIIAHPNKFDVLSLLSDENDKSQCLDGLSCKPMSSKNVYSHGILLQIVWDLVSVILRLMQNLRSMLLQLGLTL